MRSSFYTLKLWRIEAFTQTLLLRTEVFTRKLYTKKLWHREASKQSIFYTQKHLHAQKLYIHTELLHTDAFTHRSLFTELTDRRFDAERPLHRAAFTHRRFYTEMHRAAFAHKRPQAFTHRSFYTQALHREASTQSIFQTQKHLHTKALHTHTQKLYTHTPVHTELLHTDAFTHRSLFTEQGLHRAAFTQREAFAQSSLYNLIHTETLNTQMPKLLHRQVFTHRGIYTKVLHTDAADASTHRSFRTQMPFHTEAFTQRGFDIYTPMHTEAFRHRWFFRESQKLWQRIFYTQKLLHTQAFPQKLLHREAFEHELLHTDVFTNRRLVHTGLLRTEAFTQRSLYTQTLSHRKTDSTVHRAAFTHFKKSQFYVFDVWPSYRAKGLHPALENRNSWRWTIILREMGCAWPCKIAFLHQFYFAWNSCAWRSKMDSRNFTPILERLHLTLKKAQFSHSYYRLAFMPRLHLNFQNTPVFDGWPSFRAKGLRRALPNLHFATCLDVRPARSLSPQTVAAGPRTNKTRISPHVWVSDTPQRVTFRKPPPGCRCRQREIEELEKSDFAGVHIQFDHWKLAELLCSNSCATISVQMTLQAGLL